MYAIFNAASEPNYYAHTKSIIHRCPAAYYTWHSAYGIQANNKRIAACEKDKIYVLTYVHRYFLVAAAFSSRVDLQIYCQCSWMNTFSVLLHSTRFYISNTNALNHVFYNTVRYKTPLSAPK